MIRRAALLFLLLAAGFAVGRWAPFGVTARTAEERRYVANALEMRNYLNNHPVSRLFSTLLVFQTSISSLRTIEGSCVDAADPALPSMVNTVAELVDRSFFGLPIARYQASCAGLSITRGRIRPQRESGDLSRTPGPAAPSPPPPPPPAA